MLFCMRYFLSLLLMGCAMATPFQAATPEIDEIEQDIERYVKRLESKNASVCMDAVDYLPYFGTRAVPALVRELRSKSANGRGLAAATLARIPSAMSIPALIERLEDDGGVKLNVISDDGEKIHPAYDNPALNVKQQARVALTALTGKRFGGKAAWVGWWKKNKDSFIPRHSASNEPAFSIPEYARPLKGLRIAIDPGHGGDTHKRGYKRGPTYMSEAEVNLRVSRFLRDFLAGQGAEVFLTRDSDRDISLRDRAQYAATVKADLFLSVHHNWAANTRSISTTTWYHESQDHKPASVDLARYVQEETLKVVAPGATPPAGGLMADTLIYPQGGFGVLRELPDDVAGCLIETTYYSNLAMERRLRDIAFNREEAYGMFLGIARYVYYGLPRAEVVSADEGALLLKVFDGLETRGAWARPFRILKDFIVVKIDGKRIPHTYDPGRGEINVPGPFSVGDHFARVDLINIHKNHSLPKAIKFRVGQ